MPGFNPDNINIHDLTIEEPMQEREVVFDVEKEITFMDRKNIQWLIEGNVKKSHFYEAAQCIAQLKVLGVSLDEFGKGAWGLPQEDLNKVEAQLRHDLENDSVVKDRIDGGVEFVFLINSISEHAISYPDPGALKNKFDRVRKYEPSRFLFMAARMKEAGYDFAVLEEDKKSIRDLLDSNKLPKPASDLAVSLYVKQLADAKVLGLPITLAKEDWNVFRGAVEGYKHPHGVGPSTYYDRALDLWHGMAILAADEVQIPPSGGLKLIRHKVDFSEKIPEPPEERKF